MLIGSYFTASGFVAIQKPQRTVHGRCSDPILSLALSFCRLMAIDDRAVVTSIISGGNGELLCAAPYVSLFWNVCPEDESDDKDGFCRCSMIDAATDIRTNQPTSYFTTTPTTSTTLLCPITTIPMGGYNYDCQGSSRGWD